MFVFLCLFFSLRHPEEETEVQKIHRQGYERFLSGSLTEKKVKKTHEKRADAIPMCHILKKNSGNDYRALL